jgi:hypothetical protein
MLPAINNFPKIRYNIFFQAWNYYLYIFIIYYIYVYKYVCVFREYLSIYFPTEKQQDDMGVQCSLRSLKASRARRSVLGSAGTLARGARCVRGEGHRRCRARSVLPLLEKNNNSMLEKNIYKIMISCLKKYYTLFWEHY